MTSLIQSLKESGAQPLESSIILIPSSHQNVQSATHVVNELINGENDVHIIGVGDENALDWPMSVSGKP